MTEIKSFDEFCRYVMEYIKEYMPKKYSEVQIQPVRKANQPIRQALLIRAKKSLVCPAIYLNDWYERFQEGEAIERILSKIAEERLSYNSFSVPQVDFDSKTIKDRITLQAIGMNVMENKQLLDTVPHRIFGDISAVYRLDMGYIGGEQASVLINNDLARHLGYTTSELHQIAVENTERMHPPCFESISSVMEKMGVPFSKQEIVPLYVLSNNNFQEGAASIFYPGIFERISGKIGRDFYVIPSSIHEVLILDGKAKVNSIDELNELIYTINVNQVRPEEQLSNMAYEYDFDRKRLYIFGTSSEERDREIDKEYVADQIELGEQQKNIEKKNIGHGIRRLR